MALTVQSLTELDSTVVSQQRALASALLQEEHPSLELRRGVIYDNVLSPHAILAAALQENVDRLRQAMSIDALQANPTIADDTLVDAVASNFLISRRSGTVASGQLTIVLNQRAAVTIARGTVFEAQGKEFVTTSAFASRVSSATVSSTTDRLLTQLADGSYAFAIDVEAAEAGAGYSLTKDTLVVPQVTIPYFVKSYATADFAAGTDNETNAQLLARLVAGVAAKALSDRLHMSAALRSQPAFADVQQDSIVGFGDIEMKRDAHTIFPGSLGGRADWYVRTQALPRRILLSKTAVLVAQDATTGKGIWQFSLDRDEAPGFYDIPAIVQAGATTSGTYTILTDTRGFDLTALENDGFLPDIATADEAAYSRFQTTTVQFLDSDTSITGLTLNVSSRTYDVTVRVMPLVAEIQDFAASRSVRNYGGDVLVKAPIPCFLRLSFNVELPAGATTPSTTAIQNALANAVNQFGFTGRLPAGYLSEVVYNYLPARSYVSAIDMFGQIRKPNQTLRYVRATDILEVPTDAAQMISGRTVAFLLDPADVAVTFTTANVPQI